MKTSNTTVARFAIAKRTLFCFFSGLIFFVIAINALHIALQTVNSLSVSYSQVFHVVDNLIMGIFTCEIVLKWYSGFVIFWKDPWNVLDFFVIFVLHVRKCFKLNRYCF